MLLNSLVLVCVTCQVIQASTVVKRDLYQTLKLSPENHPVFNFKEETLRYPVHPTVQPAPSYSYESSRGNHGPFLNPFLRHSNTHQSGSPFYYGQRHQTYDNVKTGFHPDFSIPSRHALPSPRHYQEKELSPIDDYVHADDHGDHDNDGFADGGVPDFGYRTTGGVSGPQPEVDYIPHHALNIPLEYLRGAPRGHPLKQGYSPVHYRYNDDTTYTPVDIECNKYHCPL